MVLEEGQYKWLAKDRVIYTLGPESEVLIVREIYSMFLEQNYSPYKIARIMNERGVKYGSFGPWTDTRIRMILTHPKYSGCAVFSRTTAKLRTRTIQNPCESWVIRPDAFPAIVSPETFAQVQAKMNGITNRRSNEQLLDELRAFIEKHGKVSVRNLTNCGLASGSTYKYRFGGLMAAYTRVGYQPRGYSEAIDAERRVVGNLKRQVVEEVRQQLSAEGMAFTERSGIFQLSGEHAFVVSIARHRVMNKGSVRWILHSKFLKKHRALIVVRLRPGNDAAQDFVVYHEAPVFKWGFTLPEDTSRAPLTIHGSSGDAVRSLLAVLCTDR